MDSNRGWPEPVIPVQSISESCTETIPKRYIKPLPDRPGIETNTSPLNIPVIDISAMSREEMARAVSDACRGWGFFQVVNHGVRPELMRHAREVWRGFFHLPMEEKQRYANSPATYEGYGSRLGVEKGIRLDWGDYYFLHVLPPCLKSHEKWPALPNALRDTTDEYSRELINLCESIMEAMSIGLGLDPTRLQDSFGGRADVGACLRVNYYPKCPQPELTLGLSSHSDPGGMTVLLVDDSVKGLQVRRGSEWVTIDPVRDAFIINVGDQIQRYYCWQQLDQSSSIAAPLPMAKTSSFPQTSRKKQRLFDKDSQEMKVKRMMRNRESAARSRARKLAYVKELQNKVFHLEALIKRLRRNKEFNLMEHHSVPQEGSRSQLRRTNSALF